MFNIYLTLDSLYFSIAFRARPGLFHAWGIHLLIGDASTGFIPIIIPSGEAEKSRCGQNNPGLFLQPFHMGPLQFIFSPYVR
jgi:hypothetical protein